VCLYKIFNLSSDRQEVQEIPGQNVLKKPAQSDDI